MNMVKDITAISAALPVEIAVNAAKSGDWPGWTVYPVVRGEIETGKSGSIPFFIEVTDVERLPYDDERSGDVVLSTDNGSSSISIVVPPKREMRKGQTVRGLPLEFFCHELAPSHMNGEPPSWKRTGVNLNDLNSLLRWGVLHAPALSSWESFLAFRSRSVNKTLLDRMLDAVPGRRKRRQLELLRKEYERRAWVYVGEENWGSYEDRDMWPSIGRAVGTSEYVRQELYALGGDTIAWAGGAISEEEVRLSYALALESTGFLSIVDGARSCEEFYGRARDLYRELDEGVQGIGASPLLARLGRALEGANEWRLALGDPSFSIMASDWAVDMRSYVNGFLWPLRGSEPLEVVSPRSKGAQKNIPDGLFGLSEALFIQLYNELGDGNGWQQCRYCGRWFKYQRTNGEPVYLTTNKRSGTQFCSKSHAVLDSRRRKEESDDD